MFTPAIGLFFPPLHKVGWGYQPGGCQPGGIRQGASARGTSASRQEMLKGASGQSVRPLNQVLNLNLTGSSQGTK